MGVGRTREEAVIRRLIEAWASAVRARKIGAVVAHHTDDVVMFDVPPPVAVRGISGYRKTWPAFFQWLREANGSFEIVELDIAAGDAVAFATALLRCGSKAELAKNNRPRLRLTIGLRKVRGTWKIAHEHHSFPADA
jgi:ketosteroid isomerase-like protein